MGLFKSDHVPSCDAASQVPASRSGKRRSGRFQELLFKVEPLKVVSLMTILLLWHAAAAFKLVAIPTPFTTLTVLVDLVIKGDPLYNKNLLEIVYSSLSLVVKACLLSFIVAVPLGVLMGSVEWIRKYFESVLEMVRPIPPLAWIPLSYVLFAGVDSPTEYVQTFVVFVGAFFPVLLDTIHGISMVNHLYVEAARTMGASRRQILLKVMVPGALPSIFNGIRVGFGVGWMCVVAAEFVGGKMGIGYYIWSSYSVGGRTAEIISGMIAIGVVGSIISRLIIILEKRLVPWR